MNTRGSNAFAVTETGARLRIADDGTYHVSIKPAIGSLYMDVWFDCLKSGRHIYHTNIARQFWSEMQDLGFEVL